MSFFIKPAYPTFQDVDGSPLENGYVWIGAQNLDPQSNPIAVYWDEAKTQLASQPIRTNGGYLVNDGTPARIYANVYYSIRVMDSKARIVYSSLSETAYDPIRADLANNTDPLKGAEIVGYKNRSVADRLGDFASAYDHMSEAQVLSSKAGTLSTDLTSIVQLAVDSLPPTGGDVVVPSGVKFNLRLLNFPPKINLIYRVDDDLSSPGQASDIGSGEWVNFSANSSYPLDPTGAAVNEWRFTAPFHPGLVVDVRKDIAGADSWLRPGQNRVNPVRASFNMMNEQVGVFRILYENYESGSNFSSAQFHAWRNVVTLNGVGTGQWTVAPSEGALVTGSASGAKGFVLSLSVNSTVLLWFSGKFQNGELLNHAGGVSTVNVSGVSFQTSAMCPIAQGVKRGNWAVGLPADAVRDKFVVGGKIASQRTRGTFYEEESILDPGFVWVDSYENSPANGFEVIYDTSVAPSLRRLKLRKYNSVGDIGHVGAISAHATFNDGSGNPFIKPGSFNLASVSRGGSIGRYDIVFSNPLATANYRITTGAQFAGFLTWDLKTAAGFSLFTTNAAGVFQWPLFDFDIVVVGGDV